MKKARARKKKPARKVADWMVIKNDVYRRDIFVIIGTDAQLAAWFKKYNWQEIDMSRCLAQHVTWEWSDKDRVPRHFVVVRRNEPRDSLCVALAHELNHLVFRVFTDLRIPITKENDETFNFYHSWLMSQMITLL